MTKLEIVKLAKSTKNMKTVASAIAESFPGYVEEGAQPAVICFRFAMGALEGGTRQSFLRALD